MEKSLTRVRKLNKAVAAAAFRDLAEPGAWVPGAAAVVLLFLLGQSALFCALAVAVTLYLNRLWSRLGE